MDYAKDINKFVNIEFTREGKPAFIKGILVEVKQLEQGKVLLQVKSPTNPDKTNIIRDDNIESYFARPYIKEAENGK